MKRKHILLMLLASLAIVIFVGACSKDSPTESVGDVTELIGQDTLMADDGKRESTTTAASSCSWWNSLGQGGRNQKIVLEALYSVDRQIWDQNNRVTCRWNYYLAGTWGCYIPGDWDYSNRSSIPGYSGQCKDFAREILQRASGGAASLPGGTYDYRNWYPYRNRQDAIRYAQPGEVIQLTGSRLHTAIVISNFRDGRFEVVDGNYCVSNRIAKHVINVNTGAERNADLKSYVIDCY